MTDLDPMDQRLREYAERWRASSETAPRVDLERLAPRPSARRTWWLVAASAAAVALVIAGGTRLVGDREVPRPVPPAHTTNPGDVVPWAPLPATHPQIPTETTPASPDPAEAAGQPACRAANVRAENHGTDGAAGTIYLDVRLVLVGDHSCRLEGRPVIEPMDKGHAVDIPVSVVTPGVTYDGPVLLAKGQPVTLFLGWASNWCTTPVHNDSIRLQLPGGYVAFHGFGDSPFCNGIAGSGPTPITVEPFHPEHFRPARVRSAFAQVRASADVPPTAAAGADVQFTVTLTSRRDVVLDPCPDYRITLNGPDGAHVDSYALNCAAVPYKDDQGRPYLPAGKPVRFAMEATSGSAGAFKLAWVLDVVDQREAGGTLTVIGTGQPSTAPQTRDGVLRRALEADPAVRREMLLAEPQGQFLCSLHVLGSAPSGHTFYLWLSCSDFVVAEGAATNRSGSGEPAVVQVRGSGTDIQLEKVTFPRQQSLEADIERLFPPSIANHIYDEESTRTSPSENELEAEAVREAAG